MARFGVDKQPFDVLEELAAKHKVIRKRAGFTQSEIALRSGVSLGSVKRFELTGQISLESMLKLAHILNRLEDFDDVFKPLENYEKIEKFFSNKTRA